MITIEKEIWKPVRGFEEYAEISNFGQIHRFERVWYTGRGHKQKRLQEEKWTYGDENGRGYLKATIGNVSNGVHIWVYLTFVGNIPEGYEVNHIDENKHNNRLDNLNLLSHGDNMRYGTGIARRTAANKNHPKKSKAVQALNPKTLEVVMGFPSIAESQRHGFNASNVAACCRGRLKSYKGYIWRYVDI